MKIATHSRMRAMVRHYVTAGDVVERAKLLLRLALKDDSGSVVDYIRFRKLAESVEPGSVGEIAELIDRLGHEPFGALDVEVPIDVVEDEADVWPVGSQVDDADTEYIARLMRDFDPLAFFPAEDEHRGSSFSDG